MVADLDTFWVLRLPASRKGTDWLNVLKTLVVYWLIDPGSEWRLHRQWYATSAIGELLGEDLSVVQPDTLYRCLQELVANKAALFGVLTERWQALFGVALRDSAVRSHGIMHTFRTSLKFRGQLMGIGCLRTLVGLAALVGLDVLRANHPGGAGTTPCNTKHNLCRSDCFVTTHADWKSHCRFRRIARWLGSNG